jgi:hypothetical protein
MGFTRKRAAAVAFVVGVAVAGGVAGASMPQLGGTDTIFACYATRTGAVRIVDSTTTACPRGESLVSWNQRGQAGPQGTQGMQGPKGDTGPQGPQGPEGDAGAEGPQGIAGPAGPAGTNGLDGSGFAFRGAWAEDAEYVENDVVTREGSAYVLGKLTSKMPGIPGEEGSDWSLFAAAGTAGAAGTDGAQGPQGPVGPQGPAGPSSLQLTKVVKESEAGSSTAVYVWVDNYVSYLCNGGFSTCYRNEPIQQFSHYQPKSVSATANCPAGHLAVGGVKSGTGNGTGSLVPDADGVNSSYTVSGTAFQGQTLIATALCTPYDIVVAPAA